MTVYFMSDQSLRPARDPGFGVEVAWDIPLLQGYRSVFLRNVSKRPNVDEFRGADTPEIYSVIRDRNFDAFMITGWYLKSYWQAARACFRHGVPLLIRSEANSLMPRPMPVRIAKRVVLGWLFRRARAFLTIGKLNAEFYERHGADPSTFFPSPYCVDNQFFAQEAAQARKDRRALRKRWGLPHSAFVFVMSGKLTPKKRPMDVLRALTLLRNPAQQPWLLMAGDGPLRQECEDYIRKHRLAVRITGFLNQSMMPAAYAASDCIVMSSDYGETWGLSVNEAMACGLPAIVSDRVGCAADLVAPGRTGFIYPCGNVNALAEALARMQGNAGTAVEMGAKARSKIAKYSLQAVVRGILDSMNGLNESSATN